MTDSIESRITEETEEEIVLPSIPLPNPKSGQFRNRQIRRLTRYGLIGMLAVSGGGSLASSSSASSRVLPPKQEEPITEVAPHDCWFWEGDEIYYPQCFCRVTSPEDEAEGNVRHRSVQRDYCAEEGEKFIGGPEEGSPTSSLVRRPQQ